MPRNPCPACACTVAVMSCVRTECVRAWTDAAGGAGRLPVDAHVARGGVSRGQRGGCGRDHDVGALCASGDLVCVFCVDWWRWLRREEAFWMRINHLGQLVVVQPEGRQAEGPGCAARAGGGGEPRADTAGVARAALGGGRMLGVSRLEVQPGRRRCKWVGRQARVESKGELLINHVACWKPDPPHLPSRTLPSYLGPSAAAGAAPQPMPRPPRPGRT